MIGEYEDMVGRRLEGENPATLPLRPPRISLEVAPFQTLVTAARSQCLAALAVNEPLGRKFKGNKFKTLYLVLFCIS